MGFILPNIPSGRKTCAARHQPLTCNFTLYTNATTLTASQKLAPNSDITGKTLTRAFIISAFVTLGFCCLLMIDKILYHLRRVQGRDSNKKRHKLILKVIHTVESLVQHLGDQILFASLALLVTLNHQACTISAYHYDLLCTMLLMGLITSINALINIADYFYRGIAMGVVRFCCIILQLIGTCIVLSVRQTNSFPSKARTLAIMPAACFEKMSAGDYLGFSDFGDFITNVKLVTTNTTLTNTTLLGQVAENIKSETSSISGVGEYATLILFMVFATFILIFEFWEVKRRHLKSPAWDTVRWIGIVLTGASIIGSLVIVIISTVHYSTLRAGMEVAEWYRVADEDNWTFSQLLTVFLLGSGALAFAKAVEDSFSAFAPRQARRIEEEAKLLVGVVNTTEHRMSLIKNMDPA